MSYRLPDADGIVFDFNGTLFPDERENRESWNVIAVMLRGRELSDEEFRLQNGRTDEEMIQFLLPSANEKECREWGERKEDLYKDLCISHSLDLAEGARELFSHALSRGMKIAIASFAPKMNMDWYITRFGLLEYFDPKTIIAGRTDIPSKPDGTIFRLALESIGVKAERALAFEDSPAGVQSALNAGIPKVFRLRGPGYAPINLEGVTEITSLGGINLQ